MTFFNKLIKNCSKWEELVAQNKFITKLLDQKISKKQMYQFWIQSCLYMRIFQKCFYVLRNMENSFENLDFADYFLSRMKNTKNNISKNSYGFDFLKSEDIKMNSATTEYVNFLINIANDYNYGDLLATLAPCVISYGLFFEMFNNFEEQHGHPAKFDQENQGPAKKWFNNRNRSTKSYSTLKYINYLNHWAEQNKNLDFDQLSDLFNIAVECEINFFYIISKDPLITIF